MRVTDTFDGDTINVYCKPHNRRNLVKVTMPIQDTSEPNRNGRMYVNVGDCIPNIYMVNITPVGYIRLINNIGKIILDELLSYKISYSDYINEFRYDYARRLHYSCAETLHFRHMSDCSFSHMYPPVDRIQINKFIKAKLSSIYGYFDTDMTLTGGKRVKGGIY